MSEASSQQMEAFGLLASDFEVTYPLWPCVARAFRPFEAMGTQWRVGVNGAVGLDYAPLWGLLEILDIGGADRHGVFEDIRRMEHEALRIMNAKENKT
ncbi:MAG: hypothetical protein GAK45_00622 [Pseudomonas citronellolis]|nr:MAG: hypothetical protein GAK45_00622 [Pseudomonas citronellolis]